MKERNIERHTSRHQTETGMKQSGIGRPGVPGNGMGVENLLYIAIAAAALLWLYMFSPWTAHISNFWLNMTVSACILSFFALFGLKRRGGTRQDGGTANRKATSGRASWKKAMAQVVIGVAIAFALWGAFWVGDKVSQLLFDFARGQVDNVYGMKSGVSPALITVLLLFLIGPAEEFFWRGYVQRTMSDKIGATAAMFVTTGIYALVHIWSFNFMLVMAALVAGAVWGFIYRLKPSLLPALIISHALWDALVFVILPI